MLQQTQVVRVVDYYARFLERFPTVHDVARARPARVREAWAGLGYYARARNLHALAREVTDRGRAPVPAFPRTAEDLRRLPGVGAYTAGAVASFAFERRAALVDTNVARVLARVFAPGLDPKRSRDQRALWQIAERILPRTGRATWTHNQALMELGALVCTARVARCESCPVRAVCASARVAASASSRASATPSGTSPSASHRTSAPESRRRSAAGARSSAPCPAASPPTGRASPPSAPRRTAP